MSYWYSCDAGGAYRARGAVEWSSRFPEKFGLDPGGAMYRLPREYSPLGLDSATADCRNESSDPSTRHPSSLKWFRRSWNKRWRESTFGFPRITSPLLARVIATLRRLGSFRKPIPVFSLLLTHERMMKSFSRPWNASTDATSTSPYNRVANTPVHETRRQSNRPYIRKYKYANRKKRTGSSHVLHHVGALSLVRRHHTDAPWVHPAPK